MDQDGLPGDPTSKVSLVDVDNNDIYEICFGGRGGRLHVLDGAGHALWTWDDPNPDASISGPPQALDIDQDGFVEFLIADSQGFIYCVNHAGHDGDDLWVLRVEGGGNEAQPTICDIDRDDEYEVLWAGLDGTLHCIDALHGDEEWSFRTGGAMPANPVVVMDINSDREYEAIVWNDAHVSGGSPQPGAVLCVNCFGQEVWRWTHPKAGGGLKLCQALGDTDLDGSMNMVIMSTLGMFCLDIGGESPATKWEINLGDWVEKGLLPAGAASNDYSAYQLIADIDGDSDLEILWLAPFPIVTDGSTGELEACFVNEELDLGGRQENGGWWGDLDRDGRSEWICELKGESHRETQLYCLTMKGVFPAWSPWPEYYHSAYPAEYQREQEWLVMDSAYSNSLWFPILESPELPAFFLILASILVPRRRPSCLIPHVCR